MRLFWDVFAPLPVTIRANVYQVTIEITHPPGMNFGADFLQNYGRIHNENGGFAKISCLGSFHSLWRMHRSAFTPFLLSRKSLWKFVRGGVLSCVIYGMVLGWQRGKASTRPSCAKSPSLHLLGRLFCNIIFVIENGSRIFHRQIIPPRYRCAILWCFFYFVGESEQNSDFELYNTNQ